jgi:hypothetical protein
MNPPPFEQRNPYKGSPPRPWVRLRLEAPSGSIEELEVVADTGNPFTLILGTAAMSRLQVRNAPTRTSNFGLLRGGWFRLAMPDFGLVMSVLGYASDAVLTAVKASSPDFEGLAGLPLFRMVEYGGDADWFWIRPAAGHP